MRRDLPIADQMVQVGHVCQGAGGQFCIPPHCRLVLLSAADRPALEEVIRYCRARSVDVAIFEEPDPVEEGGEPMGLTAVCTQPVSGEARKWFRKFRMWR